MDDPSSEAFGPNLDDFRTTGASLTQRAPTAKKWPAKSEPHWRISGRLFRRRGALPDLLRLSSLSKDDFLCQRQPSGASFLKT